MAQGMRNGGTDRARSALEACIARLRRGESIAQALADCSDETDDLRSLLTTYDAVRGAAVAPPPPPGGLAAGRERFLAAAGALRDAQGAALNGATASGFPLDPELDALVGLAAALRREAVPAPALNGALSGGRARFLAAAEGLAIAMDRQPADAAIGADALDTAIQRLMAGETVSAIVAGASGDAASALAGLLGTVQAVAAAAPAPAADLSAGRARLLHVAGGVRALRAPERVAAAEAAPAANGLLGWLGGFVRPLRPHVAAMAAVMGLAVFAGNALLVPVSAGARPGDGLLYRHKLLIQDLRLAVAVVDPGWRASVRAEISRERLADIAAASADDVEVSVDGRLRGFEDLTQPGEKGHGLIHVVALGEQGSDRSLTAAWRAGVTRMALPEGFASLGDVPAGASLRLKVRTGDDPPLALKVAVLGLDPLVPLTATLTVTATPTITLTQTPGTPSPTPTDVGATATLTPTAAATSTLAPTATTTPTPTLAVATPTIMNPVVQRGVPRGQELEGQVLRIDGGSWTVRRAANERRGDPAAVAIDVAVSMDALSNAQVASAVQVGDRVRLRGEYVNGRRDQFAATKIISHMPRDVACKDRGAVLGVVAKYQPGAGLVLEDGTSFEFDAAAEPTIEGDIQVGSTVVVAHQECGGRLVARAVTVSGAKPEATPASQEYNGVVRALLDAGSLSLEIGGASYTVRFDPATVTYQGQPAVVEPGQRVSVWGRVVDEAARLIEAERVVVLRLAPPGEPTPTATLDPVPSSTPEPSPTSTPGLDIEQPVPPALPPPPEQGAEG